MRGLRRAVVAPIAMLLLGTALPSFAQSGGGIGRTAPPAVPDDASASETPLGAGSEQARSPSSPGLSEDIVQGMMPPHGSSASLAGAVDPATYRVGPGDVLQLLLWGKVSKSLVLEVGPEGQVLLPGAGTFKVDGRTLTDVKRDVLERMSREFRGVTMDLRLVRPRTFRVYLTGEVRVPGPMDVSGTQQVADVVTPALLLDDASRRHIEVHHRDGTYEIADLDLFLRDGDMSQVPLLRDGDVIMVPVATDWVYASGAVARPGRIELGGRDSLLTLFHLAGDPLPAADAERALLVRFARPFTPESLWFGLADVYSRHLNPVLRGGDRLYVFYVPLYHLQQEATVLGEVARPGVYPITEGRHHLSDMIAAAGGFLPLADLSAIRVNRHNPTANERDPELDRLLRLSRNELTNTEYDVLRTRLASLKEDFRVDWSRLMADKADLDLLMRDGDIVRVERLVPSVRVDGEVRRPGILAYRAGLRVEDYLRQAGGLTDRAWKGRVRVTRAVTGQTILAKNVSTLDPGDIIWVPERRDSNVSQGLQTFVLFAAQVATIVLAVTAIRK